MAEAHSLQVAQVLADLNDLNIADPDAALALVTANQTLNQPRLHSISFSTSKPTKPSSSQTSLTTASSTGRSTPLSRLSLQRKASSGLEAEKNGAELDPDLQRAKQLLALHEMWSTAPQQQMAGLEKARANVEEIAARYGWLAAQAKRSR